MCEARSSIWHWREMKAWPIVTIEVSDTVCLALHLAARETAWIIVDHAPDEFDALHRLRSVIGEHRRLALRRRLALGGGVGRIVAQMRVLDQDRTSVDTEAVDAAVEPKAHDIRHRSAHL